jgi:large subunit ribosomal protein L24
MHVKKGDTVYILAGKDKGKTAKILRAFPQENKVLVEGVNVKKVHEKAKKSGTKGQIVERSFPIHASNVRLADKIKKALPKKAEPKKSVKKDK